MLVAEGGFEPPTKGNADTGRVSNLVKHRLAFAFVGR
jgi:hypothetical protein